MPKFATSDWLRKVKFYKIGSLLFRRQERISRTLSITEEMSFLQWLGSIFSMSDDDIYDRCGNDALQYLRFVVGLKHCLGVQHLVGAEAAVL